MMHLNEDGSIGDIADGIFHKGMGRSIAQRNFIPHVDCVKLTPDQKFLCAVDNGLDQVKIYRVDYEYGKLELVDIIRGTGVSSSYDPFLQRRQICIYSVRIAESGRSVQL